MRDKIIILKEKINEALILLRAVSKKNIILGIFLILAIGFLLYNSLIAVQMKRLKTIDFQFVSKKKLIDSYSQLIKQTDVLKRALKDKEKELSLAKQKFVDEKELSNYFANFRELVKSHRLKLLDLNFNPREAITDLDEEPLTYFQRLRFNASMQGGYFDVMFLLYKLEQDNPKLFDIQYINIRQESRDSPGVIIEMKAIIYILIKRT